MFNNIEDIKKKSANLASIINILYYGLIIILLVVVGFLVYSAFMPLERFNAIPANGVWNIDFSVSENFSLNTGVTFKIMQPGPGASNPKTAFMIILGTSTIIKLIAYISGAKLIKGILVSCAFDDSPFNRKNVDSFRYLGYLILCFSALESLIQSFAASIIIQKIFYINISNISLTGILAGLLILVFSGIIKYGMFLQEDFDTTL